MYKAQIKKYGEWYDVTIVNIQLVPRIQMVRNDLEYKIEQTNEIHVIYIDENNQLESYDFSYFDDIKIL